MGDYYYADIKIPKCFVKGKLKDIIDNGDNPLNQCFDNIDDDNGILFCECYEAKYGYFEEFEAWLRDNQIPYDRFSEAYGEYQACIYYHRPGIAGEKVFNQEFVADNNRDHYISVSSLDEVRELLSKGKTSEALQELDSRLDKCTPIDLLPLEDYNKMVGGFLTFEATILQSSPDIKVGDFLSYYYTDKEIGTAEVKAVTQDGIYQKYTVTVTVYPHLEAEVRELFTKKLIDGKITNIGQVFIMPDDYKGAD